MKLYHGTNEDRLNNILKDGELRSFFKGDTTDIIDECINKLSDEYGLRDDAIFLSNDIELVKDYDFVFEIDTNYLNENLLYVGDNNIADEIYDAIYKGKNDEFLKCLVDKYIDNYLSFSEYNKFSKFSNPEFLYYGEIKVSQKNILQMQESY